MKAKQKGNSYELAIIKKFKDAGWENAVSSRSESRRLDDAGVDIVNTAPFSVQCKATERAPNYHEVLKRMPNDQNINLIFHKRNRQGSVVSMSEDDFWKLAEGYY